MVPATVRGLFWDVDVQTFDPHAFPVYTIERVLERGDERAVQWLWSLFSDRTIAEVLRHSRRLSRRSANFWALILRVPRHEVRALQPIDSVELAEHTLHAELFGIKISLLHDPYELLFPLQYFRELPVADIRDIGCMKLDAVSHRGSRRDFVDLYFIARHHALPELLQLFDRKYAAAAPSRVHLAKALTYFDDAEMEPMPNMLQDADWERIRQFFEKEVPKTIRL